MKFTGYKECPACNAIFLDNKNDTVKLQHPAPCCGSSGEMRSHWPSLDIMILIEIVEKHNTSDYKESKVAIVFICTILESLLEELLWKLLISDGNSIKTSEILMESYTGRNRRITLFDKVSKAKMKVMMEALGYPDFMTEWLKISQLRNEIVHKGYHGVVDENTVVLVQRVLSDGIDLFVKLLNEIKVKEVSA